MFSTYRLTPLCILIPREVPKPVEGIIREKSVCSRVDNTVKSGIGEKGVKGQEMRGMKYRRNMPGDLEPSVLL
jgi:hypothetical protein